MARQIRARAVDAVRAIGLRAKRQNGSGLRARLKSKGLRAES